MTVWRFDVRFKTFDGGFSLTVQTEAAGGIVGLFGPSGSGKSTLLESLLGWTPAGVAHGRLTCNDIERMAPAPLAERGLVWAPQDAPLVNNQNLRKNLLLGDPEASSSRLEQVLLAVELSSSASVAGNLSGGERQRLSLARAILGADRLRRRGMSTPLLLLDEPLAAVDRPRRLRLLKWLRREIEEQSLAALFVSHAWEEVESFCDHALILDDGRLTASGRPASIRPLAIPL